LSSERRHPGYLWSTAETPFDGVATRSGPRTLKHCAFAPRLLRGSP